TVFDSILVSSPSPCCCWRSRADSSCLTLVTNDFPARNETAVLGHRVRLGRLGTRRAGINPGTNKFPELLLRTRCRIAALAGLPAPRYQIIVGEMFMEQFKIAAPISLWVLELLAYL